MQRFLARKPNALKTSFVRNECVWKTHGRKLRNRCKEYRTRQKETTTCNGIECVCLCLNAAVVTKSTINFALCVFIVWIINTWLLYCCLFHSFFFCTRIASRFDYIGHTYDFVYALLSTFSSDSFNIYHFRQFFPP